MKFYCDNCQRKYAIADEKVRGKVLKVRCKNCEHVIVVREPRAPAPAASRGPKLPPRPSARVAWHYAVNGKSFGPFEEHALLAMFESGELGDACYVWQESYGADWKPARDVPEFAAALDKGDIIRPRNPTIGVSAALEAVSIDAHNDEREEEEGFVPGSSSPERLNERLEGLRDRLKATPSGSSASPFGKSPLEIKPPSQDEVPAQHLDEPGPTALMPDDMFSGGFLGAEATDADVDIVGAAFDDAPLEPEDEDDALFPSFGGMSAADDSVIDFSRISSAKSESNKQAFSETPLVIEPGEAKNFETSQSLLIQMDSIKKQGRGKRFGMILAAVVVCFVLGGIALNAANNARKNKPADSNTLFYDDQKDELVLKTYDKEELGMVFELDEGEEIITQKDAQETADEMKAEDPSLDVSPVAAAKQPKIVADNKQPKKRPSIDDDSMRGIDVGALLNQKSKFDDAAQGSKAVDKGSRSALKSAGTGDGTGASLKGAQVKPDGKKVGPDIKVANASSNSLLEKFRKNDEERFGRETKPTGPKLGDKGVLSKESAKEGFKKISRSVGFCHQRQVSRGLPLSSAKVHLTVEIQGSGDVSSVTLAPASFRHSEFETCLQEHRRRGRWKFTEYGGKTVKIKHTYVLQ